METKQHSRTNIRKVLNSVSFTVGACTLWVLLACSNIFSAVFVSSISLGVLAVWRTGYAVNHIDIAPHLAGVAHSGGLCTFASAGLSCTRVMPPQSNSSTERRRISCLAALSNDRDSYIVRYDVFSHQLCYRRASCCGSLSPLPPSDAVVIPRDVETTSNGNGVTRSYGMVMAIEKSRTKHTSKPPQKFPATVKTVVIVGSAVHGNYFSDSK